MAEAQAKLGPKAYLRWKLHLQNEDEEEVKLEWEVTKKEEYYQAQISHLLYSLLRRVDSLFSATRLQSKTVEDFVINFKTGKKSVVKEVEKPVSLATAKRKRRQSPRVVHGHQEPRPVANRSRSFWAAILGDPRVLEE